MKKYSISGFKIIYPSLLYLITALLLVACSEEGSDDKLPLAGAPNVIGENGGTVTSSDGKVTINIPSGGSF